MMNDSDIPEDGLDAEAEPEEDDGIERCKTCRVTASEKYLTMCVICKGHYCDLHNFDFGGKTFCTKICANFFFFGDGDD